MKETIKYYYNIDIDNLEEMMENTFLSIKIKISFLSFLIVF